MPKTIFISCGDASGDVHAAHLARALFSTLHDVTIVGFGGKQLASQGVTLLQNTVAAEGFGFNGIVQKYLFFRHALTQACTFFDTEKLAVVVLIDFYGFNIHVAKEAKRRGIPVVYYISPQVWASRTWRINKLKKYVDHMLCIFPFEEALYRREGVPVQYVGHPLLDVIDIAHNNDVYRELQVEQGTKLVGILPGSRRSEVARLLPIMLDVCARINDPHVMFVLFAAPSVDRAIIEQFVQSSSIASRVRIVEGARYDIRSALTCCLVSSGTATIENTICGVPMIILYKMPMLSYCIARLIVHVKNIGMPNILAGKTIVPEYVQTIDCDAVSATLQSWLYDEKKRNDVQTALSAVTRMLGERGVIRRVVEAIQKMIK